MEPLKSCLIKYKLDFNVHIFEKEYFPVWILYKSDSHISTAEKRLRIIRNKRF